MLAMQIVKGKYDPIPSNFSNELKSLITKLICQDPKKRPSINQILKDKLISPRIRMFLSNKDFKDEFAHTILHKQNVFDRTQQNMFKKEQMEREKEEQAELLKEEKDESQRLKNDTT